jgi:hypothetical protein
MLRENRLDAAKSAGCLDPRTVKPFLLETFPVNVWLDIDDLREGSISGNLVENLSKADLVLTFISDDYSLSENWWVYSKLCATI